MKNRGYTSIEPENILCCDSYQIEYLIHIIIWYLYWEANGNKWEDNLERIVGSFQRRVLLTIESPLYLDLTSPVNSQVWVKPHYTYPVSYSSVTISGVHSLCTANLNSVKLLMYFGRFLIDL